MSSDEKYDETVHIVAIQLCQACLEGKGSECHTPGCAMFLHRVDLPFHPEMYKILPRWPHHPLPETDRESLRERIAGVLEGASAERDAGRNPLMYDVADRILELWKWTK